MLCRASAAWASLSGFPGGSSHPAAERLDTRTSALKRHSTLHSDFGNIPIPRVSPGSCQETFKPSPEPSQAGTKGAAKGVAARWAENALDKASEDGDSENSREQPPGLHSRQTEATGRGLW